MFYYISLLLMRWWWRGLSDLGEERKQNARERGFMATVKMTFLASRHRHRYGAMVGNLNSRSHVGPITEMAQVNSLPFSGANRNPSIAG